MSYSRTVLTASWQDNVGSTPVGTLDLDTDTPFLAQWSLHFFYHYHAYLPMNSLLEFKCMLGCHIPQKNRTSCLMQDKDIWWCVYCSGSLTVISQYANYWEFITLSIHDMITMMKTVYAGLSNRQLWAKERRETTKELRVKTWNKEAHRQVFSNITAVDWMNNKKVIWERVKKWESTGEWRTKKRKGWCLPAQILDQIPTYLNKRAPTSSSSGSSSSNGGSSKAYQSSKLFILEQQSAKPAIIST